MANKIALILFFFSFIFVVKGQENNFCGTVQSAEDSKFIKQFLANEINVKTVNGITYVPMTVHLVNPTNGTAQYDAVDAGKALCQLNIDFAESNIQFYLSSFEFIYETKYYNHENFFDGIQMMILNNIPGTANTYLVANAAENCGYYAPSGGAVAVSYNCAGTQSHTWAHEMGHYLSLPHTFFGWEGQDYEVGQVAVPSNNGISTEKVVDTTNCAKEADFFCDTPPDYLSYRWNCNSNGLSPEIQTDPDTVEFRSDGSYFMSYSNDGCMNRFSPLQQDAMLANLQNNKPNQIDENYSPIDIDNENIFGTYPIQGELITSNSVLLEWENQGEDVIGYYVEVSRLSGFNLIQHREFVTETSYLAKNLFNDKSYYWRITPFSRESTCNESIGPYVFEVNNVTSVTETDRNNVFIISPNPSHGNIRLNGVSKNIEGNISVFNVMGEMIFEQKNVNQQSLNINLETAPGMYILQIDNIGIKINKKFIVQ